MGDRSGQLDVAHTLAAHRDSVTSTPHFSQMMPLYFIRLYLPHKAFVVLDRTENAGTEQGRPALV